MGFSSTIQKRAADVLSQRRLAAEKRADAVREEFFSREPRAKELEKAISSAGINAARAVLRGGDVAGEMTALRDKNLAQQRELEALLIKNGYEKTALEPRYTCEKCRDTGYYDTEGRTVICNCLKQAMVQAACEELNREAPLSLSTFDAFRLDYYSDEYDPNLGRTTRAHMEKVFKFCKSYAATFTPASQSVLMKGDTGLGKTHLSLAIANDVIRRGYSVVYASAPTLSRRLEKQYFQRGGTDEHTFDLLADCDLLIIDDLGAEYHNKFNVSELYNLFNARLLRGKPVIINTNLTLRELEEVYSHRFVSRVMGNAEKLDFMGRDIRVKRK